jgi:hypothetical protein
MSRKRLCAASDEDRCARGVGAGARHLVLLVGLPVVLSCLLFFSATAYAESVKWVWPTSSGTCWHGGCATVGEGYVLSHGLANGESVPGNVFCGYHNLAGELSTRMTKAEPGDAGSWTGFAPPSPVQEYQLGDGRGDICQAWGPQWGYQINGCGEAWCGMGQLVSGFEAKPWSSSYGQPKVVVSGWIDAYRAQSASGPAAGWGYICPYFDGPDNIILEYCVKAFTLELGGGKNMWAPGTVVCGQGGVNVASPIAEFNGEGAFATNRGPGTAISWNGASTGWVNFNASISASQLDAVINKIASESGPGGVCEKWPDPLDAAEYTLVGATIGYEFHGANAVVGLTTSNLEVSTEYTPLKDTTIGVYRPSTNTFYLRNSNTEGPSEIDAEYGMPGDIPLVGDWTGDGKDTIGVYRPSTNTFYLRNSNTEGPGEIVVPKYGITGDIPLVGDWTGDGKDTIGVYRPSTNTFYLRNSDTESSDEIVVKYGLPGDTPVVGDWTGDGKDTIGVYRPSTNTFYLRNSNTEGPGEIVIPKYGLPGDTPVVGDWTGDGKDTIGVYRPSTNTFYLRNSNTEGLGEIAAEYGMPGDIPLVGDWTG